MGRRIISSQQHSNTSVTPQSVDTYFDKLVKYIPADIIAAWTAVTGLIAGATKEPKSTLLWIAFAIGLIITALWIWRQTSVPQKPAAITQILVSTFSFAVWVFALGGPFATMNWYSPIYGSLILIAFTLIVPLINPKEG